ncbi:hypothetical protein AAC387_Pa08g1253 [Persea americana]
MLEDAFRDLHIALQIEAPLSISRSGNREDHFQGTVCDVVNYSLSEDRISILTPENGTSIKILSGKRHGCHLKNFHEMESLEGFSAPLDWGSGRHLSNQSQNTWLSQKIRQCGEVVGISFDNNQSGWQSLFAFAHGRDKSNRDAYNLERARSKGSRELQGLACSINYEKSSSQQPADASSSKAVRRAKGTAKRCQ